MKTTLIAVGLACLTTAAGAQDIYVGAGYDYGLPHSGDAQSVGSVMAGVRFDTGALAYGVEADYGVTIDGAAPRDTLRLRALAAYDFGGFAAIASVGATRYDVDGGAVSNGYNVGLGAEIPLATGLTVRGEFIRDFMDEPFPTDVTTTRIGLLYQF